MSTEPIDPNEYDDPTHPPPGYQAIECPMCSLHYSKPETVAAVGPIPGVGMASTSTGSFCTRCRNRRWIWWRVGGEVV